MIKRREFLKTCFKIGGFAAITSLGPGAVEDAMGWGILPQMIGAAEGGFTTYAGWDQATESGLGNTQGSGGEDTFVVMAEGGASADETGVGFLSGADLVLSQIGSIPAVSGGYRQLTRASNQRFDMTENFANTMMTGSTWSVIMKWKDVAVPSNHHGFFNFGNSGGTRDCKICASSSNKAWVLINDGTDSIYETFTNDFPTSGVLYTFTGSNGTSYYAGFTQSGSGEGGQPTLWADFAAGDRVTDTKAMNNFSVGDFDAYQNVGSYQDGAYEITGKFGWMVVSTEFLITV